LGRYPVDLLDKKFGIIGRYLHNMGLGIDESPVMPADYEGQVKSMGHSHTLDRDSYNYSEVKRHILRLSEMVGRRLRQDGYAGRTVSIVVRYADFSTFSKQLTLQYVVDLGKEIGHTALLLLKHFDITRGIRLVGVSVSGLVRNQQLCLMPAQEECTSLTQATDAINDRYGEFTVTWASVLGSEEKQRVIAPGTTYQALLNANS
jgi:DNA polymerase-4